jgi:hypothetical protein
LKDKANQVILANYSSQTNPHKDEESTLRYRPKPDPNKKIVTYRGSPQLENSVGTLFNNLHSSQDHVNGSHGRCIICKHIVTDIQQLWRRSKGYDYTKRTTKQGP